MRTDEKHIQYVPDSKDSFTSSDISPPSYDSNVDAVVPKLTNFKQAKSDYTNWLSSLVAAVIKRSQELEPSNKQSDRENTHDPGGS